MVKSIEFGVSEIAIYTGWLSVNDKQQLTEKVAPIRNDFFKLVTSINKTIKGVHTEFYELDADDFGSYDTPVEVVKYKVTFFPVEEEKFTEEWRD